MRSAASSERLARRILPDVPQRPIARQMIQRDAGQRLAVAMMREQPWLVHGHNSGGVNLRGSGAERSLPLCALAATNCNLQCGRAITSGGRLQVRARTSAFIFEGRQSIERSSCSHPRPHLGPSRTEEKSLRRPATCSGYLCLTSKPAFLREPDIPLDRLPDGE